MKHKKPDRMTPGDTAQLNAARESLEAVAAQLVSRWETEQAQQQPSGK